MLKEMCDVLAGSICWTCLKFRDGIDEKKAVLVLTGENDEVDRYAMEYLDAAIQRKRGNAAVVYALSEEIRSKAEERLKTAFPVKIKRLKQRTAEHIYKRHTMERFFRNLFWTYTKKTRNNLLGRFLAETEINAEDVVCLAIYNFRQIPKKKMAPTEHGQAVCITSN